MSFHRRAPVDGSGCWPGVKCQRLGQELRAPGSRCSRPRRSWCVSVLGFSTSVDERGHAGRPGKSTPRAARCPAVPHRQLTATHASFRCHGLLRRQRTTGEVAQARAPSPKVGTPASCGKRNLELASATRSFAPARHERFLTPGSPEAHRGLRPFIRARERDSMTSGTAWSQTAVAHGRSPEMGTDD